MVWGCPEPCAAAGGAQPPPSPPCHPPVIPIPRGHEARARLQHMGAVSVARGGITRGLRGATVTHGVTHPRVLPPPQGTEEHGVAPAAPSSCSARCIPAGTRSGREHRFHGAAAASAELTACRKHGKNVGFGSIRTETASEQGEHGNPRQSGAGRASSGQGWVLGCSKAQRMDARNPGAPGEIGASVGGDHSQHWECQRRAGSPWDGHRDPKPHPGACSGDGAGRADRRRTRGPALAARPVPCWASPQRPGSVGTGWGRQGAAPLPAAGLGARAASLDL